MAESTGFLETAQNAPYSILPDYTVPFLGETDISTIAAGIIGVLLVAGILTVMVLARGKTGDDGDIAGVVAPALLLTCVSGVVAVVAAMRQKRAQRRVMNP